MSITFCDWDPRDRMAAHLNIAAGNIAPLSHPAPSVAPPPAAAHPTATSHTQAQPTVIVDVTDSQGVHRTITVSASDSAVDLAQRYATSVPGGISEKQFQKLVHILNETAAQHFGRFA